jgi:hypothetical protein
MAKKGRFAKTRMTCYERCELTRTQLENDRASFHSQWQDLTDFILPGAYRRTLSEHNRGDRRNLKIIDSTATFSARTLSSGMHSGCSSPARPWFRLSTGDPDLDDLPAVKEWLHVVTQRMQSVFTRSNTYNALPTLYLDLGTFATAAMLVEEDDEATIRCTPLVLGSYLLGADAKGRVRVIVREIPMSVRQIIDQFGGDGEEPDWTKMSDAVKSAYDRGQLEQIRDVVHVVMPNDDAKPDMIDSKYKPFLSVYYEKGLALADRRLLEEKGYDEFPVLVPRWLVRGADVYGTDSPGMTAIGDVKQLQLGEKKSMQAIEKMITPPMKGPALMRNVAASLLPGGTTYTAESDKFTPAHEVRFDVDKLELKQQQARYRIQRAFFEDLFLMLQQTDGLRGAREITAREIEERHEEKLIVLGPVLERLNQDLFDPLIDRTFNIMLRQGMIPEPPEALAGVPLSVEYISILAQAQKSIALAGIDRFLNTILALVTAKPDVVDHVNFEQLLEEYATATGIPPRILQSSEAVAKIRDARAQVEQAAAQAATLKDAAAGAKALSETDTQQPSALSDILAMSGSGFA